jgi:hypothetical protein
VPAEPLPGQNALAIGITGQVVSVAVFAGATALVLSAQANNDYVMAWSGVLAAGLGVPIYVSSLTLGLVGASRITPALRAHGHEPGLAGQVLGGVGLTVTLVGVCVDTVRGCIGRQECFPTLSVVGAGLAITGFSTHVFIVSGKHAQFRSAAAKRLALRPWIRPGNYGMAVFAHF